MANSAPARPQRLDFLDAAKGFLVAVMVVYHSLNYTSQYALSFRYLSFLPPSFIFITGFLIARVYYPRAAAGEPGLTKKLLLRSLRLLLLFVALNVVSQFVRSPAYGRSVGVEAFFREWPHTFVLGGHRMGVFEVLLPIAYLLALAPLLLRLMHWHRLFLPLFTAAIFALCCVHEYRDTPVANLRLMSAGLIGLLAGRWLRDPADLGRGFWIAAAALAAYAVFVAGRGYLYHVQLAGAIVAVVFFSGASQRMGAESWFARWMILLGQYSLLAYIVQIAILQVQSRFTGRPDPLSVEALGIFVGTLGLTTLSAVAARWVRARSALADRAYKLILA